MARPLGYESRLNGLSSSEQSRRVTIANSTEDLFLNMANDEPPNDQNIDRRSQAGSRRASRSRSAKLNANLPSERRSASGQLNARELASALTGDEAYAHPYIPRTSQSATVPDFLRDSPSDRTSAVSNGHHMRRSPSSFSRTFSPAGGPRTYSPQSGVPEHRNTPVSDTSGVTKHHYRANLRPSNLAYETPGSNGSAHPPPPVGSPDPTSALQTPTDGAESVGSTTAASTVWDELEELRLRIRRLEHTGNRVRSTGAVQDDAADRPYTATTMTTSSSTSHPLKRLGSPTAKHVSPNTLPAHPLLQSALAKARDVLDPEMFQSLEASVSDALAVAVFAESSEAGHSLNGSSNTLTAEAISHKRLRKKTDSLCRSLTELCIALCEEAPKQKYPSSLHRTSRDSPFQEQIMESEQSPLSYLDERRARLDRSRSAPYRPSSRLSAYAGGSVADSGRQPPSSSTISRPTLSSRFGRRRSSIPEEVESETPWRSMSRAATEFSQADSEDHDPTVRAPSRAMTEVQSSRRSPSRDLQKFSRDYTSRHPLPDRLAPSNQSSVSLSSARTSLSTSRTYRRPESRSVSRLEPSLEPSPTLAERLAFRRQQQQQQQQEVATAEQLGEIASMNNVPPQSMLQPDSTRHRRASSGRASRFNHDAVLDSDLSQD